MIKQYLQNLFNANGRIGRLEYFIEMLKLICISFLIIIVISIATTLPRNYISLTSATNNYYSNNEITTNNINYNKLVGGDNQKSTDDYGLRSQSLINDDYAMGSGSIIRGISLMLIILSLPLLFMLIGSICLRARRLHDLNKSGWLQIIAYLPIFGMLIQMGIMLNNPYIFYSGKGMMYMIGLQLFQLAGLGFEIYILFFKGTTGPNKYGPDPLGNGEVIELQPINETKAPEMTNL